MKLKTQIEVYKSIRKPLLPPRVQRPIKGGGYRRNNDWRNDDHE